MTQKDALEILKLGYNVFLTGAAGTGKTHLLNQYTSFLFKHHVLVAVTATTGIAATHIGGVTLDSWSGIGIRRDLTDKDITEMENKMYLRLRLLGTKVLIIDEASMLSSQKLDLLDRLLRTIRKNPSPFGGIQIVLCGDLFQLPPVRKENEPADFLYKAKAWQEMQLKICYLTEQFRQKDPDYIKLLNTIRRNAVTNHEVELLAKSMTQPISLKFTPTKLYTHNVDVDEINRQELQKINSKSFSYSMTGMGIPALVTALKKNCLAPEILDLKKGVLVMFVKNNQRQGYVNGTLGKVTGFKFDLPIVETLGKRKIWVDKVGWTITENNVVKAEIKQLPLRLAWAITVHKSQGMTLDLAEIDLSKAFVAGMGYVALSRLKSFTGLRLLGLNNLAVRVDPQISEFDKKLQDLFQTEADQLKKLGWWQKVLAKRKFLFQLTS